MCVCALVARVRSTYVHTPWVETRIELPLAHSIAVTRCDSAFQADGFSKGSFTVYSKDDDFSRLPYITNFQESIWKNKGKEQCCRLGSSMICRNEVESLLLPLTVRTSSNLKKEEIGFHLLLPRSMEDLRYASNGTSRSFQWYCTLYVNRMTPNINTELSQAMRKSIVSFPREKKERKSSRWLYSYQEAFIVESPFVDPLGKV